MVTIAVATVMALSLAQAQERRLSARPQAKGQGKGQAKGQGKGLAKGKGKSKAGQPGQDSAKLTVPAHAVDLILGRPTANSVTVSVLAYQDIQGSIAYGVRAGDLSKTTPSRRFATGEPVEVVLNGLEADQQYI
jgi:hypothetical protein